jgi:RNA polymerase sigma factor (sigma-70 family)
MNGQPITGGLPAAAIADTPADRLASLFDAHHERLYRLARRLVPTADDALDLVQETFLRAARFPESVPSGNTGEEAWLVRVLVNIRRDQWRKAGVRNRHAPALSGNSAETRGTHNPEAAMIARTMVWRALDLLPPRRRAIVVMHELEALSVPAIASLLGISAITVRWHLSMGRRDLARALMPYMGDSNEDH